MLVSLEMKFRVLGAFGSEGLGQRPTAFLINEKILLDAGTVTGALTIPEQLGIEHALISHSHLDHTGGLAFLAETLACCEARRPVTIASTTPVLEGIHATMFNNVLWPDFSALPGTETSVVRYRALVEGAEQQVGNLRVTPVAVSHTVPTVGFVVHDDSTGIVYSGDTGPTEALWKVARQLDGIRAIVLECAFPDRMRWLAQIARHLTPELLRRELDKMSLDVPVWVFHVKPQFRTETLDDLARLDDDRVVFVEQDKTYTL